MASFIHTQGTQNKLNCFVVWNVSDMNTETVKTRWIAVGIEIATDIVCLKLGILSLGGMGWQEKIATINGTGVRISFKVEIHKEGAFRTIRVWVCIWQCIAWCCFK